MSNENVSAAKDVDREHWLRGAPDHAATFKYDDQDASGVCPACSTKLPENTAECPECGLTVNLQIDVSTCPDCDAEVGDEVSRCPKCGAEFE